MQSCTWAKSKLACAAKGVGWPGGQAGTDRFQELGTQLVPSWYPDPWAVTLHRLDTDTQHFRSTACRPVDVKLRALEEVCASCAPLMPERTSFGVHAPKIHAYDIRSVTVHSDFDLTSTNTKRLVAGDYVPKMPLGQTWLRSQLPLCQNNCMLGNIATPCTRHTAGL